MGGVLSFTTLLGLGSLVPILRFCPRSTGVVMGQQGMVKGAKEGVKGEKKGEQQMEEAAEKEVATAH